MSFLRNRTAAGFGGRDSVAARIANARARRDKIQKAACMIPNSIERCEALTVYVDGGARPQSIQPDAGDLYTIGADGDERTFYFVDAGGGETCERCALRGETDYEKRVCDCVDCNRAGVELIALEYKLASDGRSFVPVDSDVASTDRPVDPIAEPISFTIADDDGGWSCPAPPEPEPKQETAPEPEPQPKPAPAKPVDVAQRRADWEEELRTIYAEIERQNLEAKIARDAAKAHAKRANELKARVLELIGGGSENYVRSTPLLDIAEAD